MLVANIFHDYVYDDDNNVGFVLRNWVYMDGSLMLVLHGILQNLSEYQNVHFNEFIRQELYQRHINAMRHTAQHAARQT
jgi:hypothetical protein